MSILTVQQGILAGAAIGYSLAVKIPNSPFSGLRMEAEYFYRQSRHDQTQPRSWDRAVGDVGDPVKRLTGENLHTGPDETFGSIISHNIFANVYYDFANTSRFTPYIGIGGGLGVTTWRTGVATGPGR